MLWNKNNGTGHLGGHRPKMGAENGLTTQECHILFIHDGKFDIKVEQIFQNLIQEPSTSSKYKYVLGAT